MKAKKRQSGVSVLEMVLVMALVVGLVGVAARNYNSVNTDQLTMAAARQVRSMVQVIRSRFDDMPNFSGLTTPMVAGMVPAGTFMYDKKSETFLSPWGGSMRVAPYAYDGVANMGFSIAIEQASPTACASLVTTLARDFSEVIVGNQVLKRTSNPLAYQPSVSEIAAACAPNSRNTPIVTFRGV